MSLTFKVRARHFASHDIKERVEELKGLHKELTAEVERKGRLLQGALSIHTFLSEASLQFEILFSIFGYNFQNCCVCADTSGSVAERRTVQSRFVCELIPVMPSGVGAGAVAGRAAGRFGVS